MRGGQGQPWHEEWLELVVAVPSARWVAAVLAGCSVPSVDQTWHQNEEGNREQKDMGWSNGVVKWGGQMGVVEHGGLKISSPQLCEDKKVFHISAVRDFLRAHMHHASHITQLSGKHQRNISYYVILHPARLSHCHFWKTLEVTFLILVPDFVLNSGCCMGPNKRSE